MKLHRIQRSGFSSLAGLQLLRRLGGRARVASHERDRIADEDGLEARLEPLNENGGPTSTILPEEGSALIDAIPPDECPSAGITTATDQRGPTRREGAGCDIRAVEVHERLAHLAFSVLLRGPPPEKEAPLGTRGETVVDPPDRFPLPSEGLGQARLIGALPAEH